VSDRTRIPAGGRLPAILIANGLADRLAVVEWRGRPAWLDNHDWQSTCRGIGIAIGDWGGSPVGTTPGSFPAWMYRAFRTPAFDLESDGHPDIIPALADRTTPELLQRYRNRHGSGLRNVLRMLGAAR